MKENVLENLQNFHRKKDDMFNNDVILFPTNFQT